MSPSPVALAGLAKLVTEPSNVRRWEGFYRGTRGALRNARNVGVKSALVHLERGVTPKGG